MTTTRSSDDGPLPVTTQMGPFGLVPAWVLSYDLSGSEFKVYISLMSYANADRECWPTTKAIAERACVARGTARNAIQRFRRLGLISTENRYRSDGSFGGYLYVMASINPALINPRLMELDIQKKTKGGTSSSVPATNDAETRHMDVEGGTPNDAPPYTDPCTPGTPNDAPIEQTMELTNEQTKPPAQATPNTSAQPVAEPTPKTGEGNPREGNPNDHPMPVVDQAERSVSPAQTASGKPGSGATSRNGVSPGQTMRPSGNDGRDQGEQGTPPGENTAAVTTACRLNPSWTPQAATAALRQAIADGHPDALARRALIALAAGEYGATTTGPQRLTAPGPWWKPGELFVPAPRPTDQPMCRRHRGQPAGNCASCRSEKLVGDDGVTNDRQLAGTFTNPDPGVARRARTGAAAARAALTKRTPKVTRTHPAAGVPATPPLDLIGATR